MKERIIAAIAALVVVLPTLLLGDFWGTFALVTVAIVIASKEFIHMAFPTEKNTHIGIYLLYMAAFVGFALFPEHSGLVMATASLVLWSVAMFLISDNDRGMRFIARSSFGLIYIPFLLSYFVLLRGTDQGLEWIFLALLLTWSADTGAYFAGRFLGKTPLFPRVSPKKTVEGVVGGVLLAVAVSIGYTQQVLPVVDMIHASILGVVLSLSSVVGDLVESLMKRAYGVKDSGNFMPGHGGIIDRLDSLLFTFPITYMYVVLFL